MPEGGVEGSDRGWVSRACPSQQPDSVERAWGLPGSLRSVTFQHLANPTGATCPSSVREQHLQKKCCCLSVLCPFHWQEGFQKFDSVMKSDSL